MFLQVVAARGAQMAYLIIPGAMNLFEAINKIEGVFRKCRRYMISRILLVYIPVIPSSIR